MLLQSLREQVQRQVPGDLSPMRQWVSPVGLTVVVGVAYFLTARLSLLLMTPAGVAVFWPAAGISSGTLIALGRPARWPVTVGVIAATVGANLTGDRNILSSSIFALSDAGEALLVAWLIERSIGSDFRLDRLLHVLALPAAALVGTAVAGVGGTLGYELAHNTGTPAWTVWWQWFAFDSIGIIPVAPLIIALVAVFRAPLSRRELIEGAVALIAIAATTGIVIVMVPADWWDSCVTLLLNFPVVLWIAARCRPAVASAAVFIVSLMVMATVTFKLGNADPSIYKAQLIIVGTALCAFTCSALFAERRESEARLQEVLSVGAVTAFEWDVATDSVRRSNNAAQILGYDPRQTLDGKSFLARVHPDDLARMKALWRTLDRDNPTYSTTYRFRRFDGREVWLQATSKAEFDAAGRFMGLNGLVLDITERKRAEEHQQMLVAELNHRVKNVLARVVAVADSTRHDGCSIDEFLRSYNGRIQSMAAAHALLSKTGWHGADLSALVSSQLAPYATDTNTTVAGTDIVLGAPATESLAIVLHELVTNAVKYGALSIPGGRVSVIWERKLNGSAVTNLSLVWREVGGPPVPPEIRSGYGTGLIRELIPHEVGGSVDLVFGSEGACCRIELPVEAMNSGHGWQG